MAIQPDNPGNDPGNQPKRVQETVPEWLQALLQKYDHQQGPIAGLADLYVGSAPQLDMGDTDDSISDVLEDIASDTPKPQTGKLASSVDWGVAPNPEPTPSNAMDDLLASFGEPDLEGGIPAESAPMPSVPAADDGATPFGEETEQAQQSPQEIEAPDWLSDLDSSAVSEATIETPKEKAAEPSWDSQEIPDWLNEIDNDGLPPTSDTPDPTEGFVDQDDVPDWLSEFSVAEDAPPTADTPTANSVDTDADTPDWLSDFTASHEEAQTQTEDAGNMPTNPDLESLFSDTPSSQTDQAGNDSDVPDWLAAIEEPDIAETASPTLSSFEADPSVPLDDTTNSDQPDTDSWLNQSSVEVEAEALPESTQAQDTEPDWLADFSQTSADRGNQETELDLTAGESDLGIDLSGDDDDDWFQTVLQHYPVDPALTTNDDAPPEPDLTVENIIGTPASVDQVLDQTDQDQWLANLGQEDEADDPAMAKTGVTNWLDQLQTDEDTGEDASPSPEFVDRSAPNNIDEDADSDDWLSSLADESVPFDFSGPDEQDDAPDWLLGMQAADEAVRTSPDAQPDLDQLDDSTEMDGLPDWLADIDSDTDVADKESDPTNWLDNLQDETDTTQVEAGSANVDDQPDNTPSPPTDLAGWLTETEGLAATPGADAAGIVDEDEALNWLTDADDQPEPDKTEQATESSEMDWLNRLEDATSESAETRVDEAATPEIPSVESQPETESADWLEDIEAAAQSTTQVGLPSWIAGLANADQLEAQDELEARFSAPIDDKTPDTSPTSVDLTETISTGESDEATSTWDDFTELPETEPIETEEDVTLLDSSTSEVNQDSSEEVVEIPDWMSDLVGNVPDTAFADSPPTVNEDGSTENDFEVGSTDVVEDHFDPSEISSDIAEVGPDNSDWLSSLRTELEEDETDTVDTEAESSPADWPDWMANLQDDDDNPIRDDSEDQPDEQSDWLNRLSATDEKTPDTEVVPAVPDWMSALSTEREEPALFEETDQDDGSDWLSNLQADVSTSLDEPGETISAEDVVTVPDVPDWMGSLAEDDFLDTEVAVSPDNAEVEAPTSVGVDEVLSELETEAPISDVVPDPTNDLGGVEGALPDWMTTLEADTTLDAETETSASLDDAEEIIVTDENTARFEELSLDELDEVMLDVDLAEMGDPIVETTDADIEVEADVVSGGDTDTAQPEVDADLQEPPVAFVEPVEADLTEMDLDWMSDLLPEAESDQQPESLVDLRVTDTPDLSGLASLEHQSDMTETSVDPPEEVAADVEPIDFTMADADTDIEEVDAIDEVKPQFEEVEGTLPDWMLKLEADLAHEIASQEDSGADDPPPDISLPIIEPGQATEPPSADDPPAPVDNLADWLTELGALGSDDDTDFALPGADEAVDLTSDPLSRLSNFFEDTSTEVDVSPEAGSSLEIDVSLDDDTLLQVDALPEIVESLNPDGMDDIGYLPEIEDGSDLLAEVADEVIDTDSAAFPTDDLTDKPEVDSDDDNDDDDNDDDHPPTDGGGLGPDDDDPDPSPLAGLFSGAGLRRRIMSDDDPDDEGGPTNAQTKLNDLTIDSEMSASVGLIPAAQRFFDIATGSSEHAVLTNTNTEQWSWFGHLFRAALYLAFMVILTIPLFYHYDRGGFPFPWLEPSPIEQQDIRNSLQSVVGDKLPNSLALVSFDYTPANAGEMTPLAIEVIKKLRGQGMRIVAISLDPEGAMMAQQILTIIEPDSYGADVLNLGYLPGDIIAIRQLSFANPFDKLVDFKSKQPYSQLDNWPLIEGIADIALIVTISALPDRLQWWVEQLNSTTHPPLLAVASSSAEPFIAPYVDSGQFDAVIAGISGAAALESARVQEQLGAASRMLDSQSLAHLMIMILMLAGTMTGWFTKYGQEAV